jgi:hypothetical protein
VPPPPPAELTVIEKVCVSSGWTPFESLDYCHKWGARVVHFSEIRFLGGLEPEHLRRVREHAAGLGIELEIGMKSICPTSSMFEPAAGTAEEQLSRMIRSAVLLGSPIVRAVLGSITPAITDTRPATASTVASTMAAATEGRTKGPSPMLPRTKIPSTPDSTTKLMCFFTPSRSSSSSAVSGVITGGYTPTNLLAAKSQSSSTYGYEKP